MRTLPSGDYFKIIMVSTNMFVNLQALATIAVGNFQISRDQAS